MFKVNKKVTNMKRQSGGGVSILNFQQMALFFEMFVLLTLNSICLLNFYYKTIIIFRKTAENRT